MVPYLPVLDLWQPVSADLEQHAPTCTAENGVLNWAALSRSSRSSKPLPVVGWREWVALPDLKVTQIKAKVDTGARSSCLHAFDIEILPRLPHAAVRFKVHPIQHDGRTTVACEASLLEERWVRSSNGKREYRPVIRTMVAINDASWPIDLTLTSRDSMGFRMLLGREAIRKRFIVDPGASFVTRRAASQQASPPRPKRNARTGRS